MSMRSMVSLDKSFPKPPMPNCVRLGNWNVAMDPTQSNKSTLSSKWSERRALFATAVRYHSPDVLAMQEIQFGQAGELLDKMSDYAMMDGASEHFEAEGVDRSVVPGADTRPFLPIFYFRWRLQLADSGNLFLSVAADEVLDADLPIDTDVHKLVDGLPGREPSSSYIWITWGLFQDVFTESSFYVFACDLTPACETPEGRRSHMDALKRVIAMRVGDSPFVLAFSGFLDPGADLDGAQDEFNGMKMWSMGELGVEPGHEHVGPVETFVPPGEGRVLGSDGAGGGGMVLDHVFYRDRYVEVLQSGVTEDLFISGARPAMHSLVVCDLILDMEPL